MQRDYEPPLYRDTKLAALQQGLPPNHWVSMNAYPSKLHPTFIFLLKKIWRGDNKVTTTGVSSSEIWRGPLWHADLLGFMLNFPAATSDSLASTWIKIILGDSNGTVVYDYLVSWLLSLIIMGILATPPKATPPKNKALLRDY